MKKLYNKVSYDMKVVRDTFHGLTIGQKLWLIFCVLSTVIIILRIVNKITRKLLDKFESIRNRKLKHEEEDYSDKCPDECSDPFDDYDDYI